LDVSLEMPKNWAEFSLGRKRVMGFMIFAALFGLAIAGSVVQFAVLRRTSFSLRAAVVSGILAVLFVLLVATMLDIS
jgi:hypothetical protein